MNSCQFLNSFLWNFTTFAKPLSIAKCNFAEQVNFANANFNSQVTISRTDYKQAKVYFDSAVFEKTLLLGRSLTSYKRVAFEGVLSFRSTLFESDAIIRIFNLNDAKDPKGKIDFANALIKGLIDIREIFVESIGFDGAVVTGTVQDNGSIHKAIRDANTARLLKHEARKINNHLSALHYYQREMDIYAKTLRWWQGDWWLLQLNRISNKFGSSWPRGVLFTIAAGLIFYTVFRLQLPDCHVLTESFWAGFINYFWLPTGFDELVNSKNPVHVSGGIFGALFFIMGKVLIAYGIYQVIAAFRKHLK